jgi:hypothetical protein
MKISGFENVHNLASNITSRALPAKTNEVNKNVSNVEAEKCKNLIVAINTVVKTQ